MFKTYAAFLALASAFVIGLPACVGGPAPGEEEGIVEDEAAITLPDRSVVGTYRSTNLQFSFTAPQVLALMSDGTFHSDTAKLCLDGTCWSAENDGRYVLTHERTGDFITLRGDDRAAKTYKYHAWEGGLWLLDFEEKLWITMEKTPEASWCGEPLDCRLQGLTAEPCLGRWTCGANVCDYQCTIFPIE